MMTAAEHQESPAAVVCSPQALRHKLTRDGTDPDRPLANDFPDYVAAMVYRYLGLKMPECVTPAFALRLLRLRCLPCTRCPVETRRVP